MHLGAIADNVVEWVLARVGLAPLPLADTMVALLLARTVMAGTRLNVFEALAPGPLTVDEVARRCGTNAYATERLLFALAGARYLRARSGRYELAPIARRWLLANSKRSLRDAVLHRYLDAALIDHYEEFVRSGNPANFHQTMASDEWDTYQRGQRSHAILAAPEVALRTPVRRGARAMLDIGGAHGYYAVALCRRHRGLRATIIDLPDAVTHSAPLLAREGMGDRITYRAEDIVTADLGRDRFDLIFIANLVHHFDDDTNRDLMRRVARALRSGGSCVVLEFTRKQTPEQAGQIGALLHLYFAATSESGVWSFAEMAAWQRAAGLRPRPPITLLTVPGAGLQVATKGTSRG